MNSFSSGEIMNRILFIALIFIPATVFSFTGTNISSEVSELYGKKLQWTNGNFDYFVMFKSLIENNTRVKCSEVEENESLGCDLESNPEGDTCLSSSTFTLKPEHIPNDAYVEAAYLVWSGNVDPDKTDQPVENTANFSFISADGSISIEKTVTAGRKGVIGTDSENGQQDFIFEGMAYESEGATYGGNYTYRVDITDIFDNIHDSGREAGITLDGNSLLGDYTVGNTVCSDDELYVSKISGYSIRSSNLTAGWAIILVFQSEKIDPKMINIYNGFSFYNAQNQEIKVSGFELTDNPKMKVTIHTLEGDPGISAASNFLCSDSNNFEAPCPPEGLSVSGEQTPSTEYVILWNDCNPPIYQDMNGTAFNYSETYNSISSIYSVDAYFPECIGGDPNNPSPDELEYTMDVDTFLIDPDIDPNFNSHFQSGDTSLTFKLGANMDSVYTNILIVAVDTKPSRYNIPPNPYTPSGREKFYCGCSPEVDTVCFDSPFYYALKIENWGDDTSSDVTVQDTLSEKVTYVPGTTEICRDWESSYQCSKWTKIEDGNAGVFPLEQPYSIAKTLDKCNQTTHECPDTIMIRFKVKPADTIEENEVIENTAIIRDSEGELYRTNSSVPLRLTSGSCPSEAECKNPDLTECGGVVENSNDENNNDSSSDSENTDDTDNIEEQENDSDQSVSEKDDNSASHGNFIDGEHNDSSGCSCSLINSI